MPKGRPKKVVEPKVVEKATPVIESPEVVEAPRMAKVSGDIISMTVELPKPVLTGWDAAIAESRKLLEIPLQAGQIFFESPEGFIMVDEETRGKVWCRQADKGRGMWINPRRI